MVTIISFGSFGGARCSHRLRLISYIGTLVTCDSLVQLVDIAMAGSLHYNGTLLVIGSFMVRGALVVDD